MRKLLLALSVVAVLLLGLHFARLYIQKLLTSKSTYALSVHTRSGGTIPTSITRQLKGLFIDGGHAFSFGGRTESFEMTFLNGGEQISWSGPETPFNLQVARDAVYLATFDRSDVSKPTFRCFQWKKTWESMELRDFPKHLVDHNLLLVDDFSGLPFEDANFAYSLLATFCFCVGNDVQYWEAPDKIDPEFLMEFHKKWLRPNSAEGASAQKR